MTQPMDKQAAETTERFVAMVGPAFPMSISGSNIGVVLKRCSILLNTQNHLYLRATSVNNIVERHPLMGHYIAPRAGERLYNWVSTVGAYELFRSARAIDGSEVIFLGSVVEWSRELRG